MFDTFTFEYNITPFSSWYCIAIVSLVYLLAIWGIRKYMEDKPSIRIRPLQFAHNLLLCGASMVMLCGALYEVTLAFGKGYTFFDLICDPGSRFHTRGGILFWIWIFHLSKVYELLDTLFILLSKSSLRFLHVYHHVLTLFITWYALCNAVTMQWFGLILNTFVHVLMYYYYAQTTFGYTVWWKDYLTMLQMIQFVVNLAVVVFWSLWKFKFNCSGDWATVLILVFANVTFLLLFIQFFMSSMRRGTRGLKTT